MTVEAQPKLPEVSVVVPTRDRPRILQRCLAAVLADEGTREAVVVLDGDDPATMAMLTPLAERDPRVTITRAPAEPAELARLQRARDHGVRTARSEIVLSIDDDVVAHPGMVSDHARRHTAGERIVVVGYMPVATTRRWPRSQAPVRFYSIAYETHCAHYRAKPASILRQLWGGNVSVRRADWLRAVQRPHVATNMFDDRELGLLLLEDGLEAIFDPELVADHYYERSLRGFVARAQSTAREQATMWAAHPDQAEGTEELTERRVHTLLLRLSRSRIGWWLAKWGLISVTWVAGAIRLRPVENRGAELLWRVAFDRTARQRA